MFKKKEVEITNKTFVQYYHIKWNVYAFYHSQAAYPTILLVVSTLKV